MNEELLFESERSRITRVTLDGGKTAIGKRYLGSGAVGRAQNERTVLSQLSGIPGIPVVLTEPGPPDLILLEDLGGESLDSVLDRGRLDPEEVFRLAIDLVGTIAGIHRRHIMHRDISPANILVWGHPRRTMLIDFELAGSLAEGQFSAAGGGDVIGTLAYIAPERTGRTGWDVDQRADLYSLGATLYEMAVGTPPFEEEDPLALTRDHLNLLPTAPHDRDASVPWGLSSVIMHLLEKEPDRRYQSAEGVLYDLRHMIDNPARGLAVLGRRDFPPRLASPAHPIGRDAQIRLLTAALAETTTGASRSVIIGGQTGVGKTALVNEIRPHVASARGWFLPAKFDQYHVSSGARALQQLLTAMASMLLTEPEEELAALRAEVRRSFGSQGGLLTAAVPALAPVLRITPSTELGDPGTARERLHDILIRFLVAVAHPTRPLVLFFDDIQWADTASLALFDALVRDERTQSVLLLGTYRAGLPGYHPLPAYLERWNALPRRPLHITLDNLDPTELRALIAHVLRIPPAAVAGLADRVEIAARGNPFDTVEMLNSLRHDGALVLEENGWTWRPEALRHHEGLGDVLGWLTTRLTALPDVCRQTLETMALIGGAVEIDALAVAAGTGLPPGDDLSSEIIRRLEPALEDGLLVLEMGLKEQTAIRFSHDRIEQAVYNSVPAEERAPRHQELAGRLGTRPQFVVASAEQYLAAIECLTDPAEGLRAIDMLRSAAQRVRFLANHSLVERYLGAADQILDRFGWADGGDQIEATRLDVDVARHAALYALGKFEEVDRLFERIRRRCDNPQTLTSAAAVQISSLTNRGNPRAGLDLGLELLSALGRPVPAADELAAAVDRGMEALRAWAARGDEQTDDDETGETAPVPEDPLSAAIGRIIYHIKAPAFFCESNVYAWLIIEARRLWEERGPNRALLGVLAAAPVITIALHEDYDTGFAINSRVLRFAERHGYEPETSEARYHHSDNAACWFLPLEDSVRQARLTREGLLREGETQFAAYTYYASLSQLFDCATTLDDVAAELTSGFALAERTGNSYLAATFVAYQQAIRTLRGETKTIGDPNDAHFDEAAFVASLGNNPAAAAYYYITRAMVAAIFGDGDALHHAVQSMTPFLPLIVASYVRTTAYLVRALDLAARIRAERGDPARTEPLLREFDECRDWLDRRAQAHPGGFLHLRLLLDAERAMALGTDAEAFQAYDQARWQVEEEHLPWHQALITERLARFHLARGTMYSGRDAMREARMRYRTWGAAGKVRHLEREYSFLRGDRSGHAGEVLRRESSGVSSETVDLLAVLRASQALSSETDLNHLRARVVEVLRSLTGATDVYVLGWRPDAREWRLVEPDGHEFSVADPRVRRRVPLSVFRYVDRVQEPLLVDDAVCDDRFAGDSYFDGMGSCSLMAIPILTQNDAKAILILESRHTRAAFGSHRLDLVRLIAGQLAVSLDNALLYASLERKVAVRTSELRELNERLGRLAITDPLTGLANRRYLMHTLEAEWASAAQSGTPIGVAMIDVDHFKLYNDFYGHMAGDRCLRKVAGAIGRNIRDADVLARYGGEEFAIILPGADAATTRAIADRARGAVAALHEPHQPAEGGIVTVSVGVAAVVPVSGSTAEDLVRAADTQLYLAKAKGRNQVSGADPSPAVPS